MDLTTTLERLMLTHDRITDAIDERLRAGCDLPLNLYRPLRAIASIDDCRIHDVSSALGLTTGGVSKIIDRAEARGLCRRLPKPGDSRSSLLVLTRRGEDVLGRAEDLVSREMQSFFGDRRGSVEALDAALDSVAEVRRRA